MEVLALGLTLPDGLIEALNDEDGDREPLGLLEADGETEALMLTEAELDGEIEADGDSDALGEADTPKLCIQIIQFSLVRLVTFLNS